MARIPETTLEDVIACFRADPNRYGLAGLIVSMLHAQCFDLRGQSVADDVADQAWDKIAAKYETALDILDMAQVETRNSPLLYGERMSLLYFSPEADRHIFGWFEAAVKADPGDSAPLMEMGNMMLPRWFGGYEEMERTARQASVWTKDEMGTAAYAILYNSALETEGVPLFFMETELYAEAARDLALYRGCSPVLLPGLCQFLFKISQYGYPYGMTDAEDRARWDKARHTLHMLSLKLLEDYLPAVHPDSWDDGERGARYMISLAMGQELEDGLSLIVGPRGIRGVAPQPAE